MGTAPQKTTPQTSHGLARHDGERAAEASVDGERNAVDLRATRAVRSSASVRIRPVWKRDATLPCQVASCAQRSLTEGPGAGNARRTSRLGAKKKPGSSVSIDDRQTRRKGRQAHRKRATVPPGRSLPQCQTCTHRSISVSLCLPFLPALFRPKATTRSLTRARKQAQRSERHTTDTHLRSGLSCPTLPSVPRSRARSNV